MSKRAVVKQVEIKRTVQAALAAGIAIQKIEVDHATGRVVVFPEGAAAQAAGPDPDELLR